jgi:hypothetical protein
MEDVTESLSQEEKRKPTRRQFLEGLAIGATGALFARELKRLDEVLARVSGEGKSQVEKMGKLRDSLLQLNGGLKELEEKIDESFPDRKPASFSLATAFPPLFDLFWYDKHPDFLKKDVVDPRTFANWVWGEGEPKEGEEPPVKIDPQRAEGFGEEEKKAVKEFVRRTFQALIKKYPNRAKEIFLTDRNEVNPYGRVFLEAPSSEVARASRLFREAALPIYLHEFAHVGLPRQIREKDQGNRFNFTCLGGGLPFLVKYWQEWMGVMVEEWEFFQKRFFRHPKDELKNFLSKGEVGRVIDEAAAMLVVDYLLPPRYYKVVSPQEFPDRLPPSEWPEAVRGLVAKSLKFARDGPISSWGSPLVEEEIDQMRKEVGGLLTFDEHSR